MGRKRLTNLGLPERVYFEHGAYFFVQQGHPKVKLGHTLPEMEAGLKRIGVDPIRMHAGHLGVILANARKNARTREIPFELTRSDLGRIWMRSGGRCELCLLPFDLLNVGGFTRRAYAPSIDRIDGSKGYSLDNCRLILVALNMAINEWGEEIFARIASSFLRHKPARAAKIFHSEQNIQQGLH